MSPAARSVCYFGYYLYVVGICLLVIPNQFLKLNQMPETQEVWIRVVGTLVLAIAYYYHRMGAAGVPAFLKLTVHARIFVFLAFIAFVLLKFAPPMLVAFGTIDLMGALWTWTSLKKSAH